MCISATVQICLHVCLYMCMSICLCVCLSCMSCTVCTVGIFGEGARQLWDKPCKCVVWETRVNDNEWMTMFPIIRRMCVFLVELLVRAVGCNFLQQKRVEKPRWMRHCTPRKELQLNYFYLNWMQIPDGSDVQLWVSLNPTQVAETHKGAERRLLSSLGTCPGTTTYHKSWEHVPMISHVSVEVPSDWRTDSGHFRTQKMWSWPKSDFTCFHPRCYFSVSSTTIVKKSTQGGWRKTCCSLLSWCKLEPKIGLTMINIVLLCTIHYYLLFAHPQITTLRHMIRIWTRNEQQKWSKMAGVPLLLASKKLLASLPFLTKIYHNYSQLI